MAVMCLTGMYVSLNSSDLSSWAKKAELTVEVDEVDVTAFGDSGWKKVIGGLKSGTLAITANDDVAASQIDSILWPLLGTVVAFEVRATQSAVGTSNPKYTGNVLITGHKLGGDIGSAAEKDLSLPTSGAVTRATS